ncbi:MAG TPA: CYTH domain-containing protein [Solirubrobacterales bacterium]|nr:CYTH domain-containing protein [Solirubrobacterales bacterium]
MAAGIEIERKFLLRDLPAELREGPGQAIEQGYLAIHADGTEVRVRSAGGRCTLTVKAPGGLSRAEVELEIGRDRFCSLWPLTAGRRLRKRRSTAELSGGVILEVDRYQGALSGLVIAEAEFGSEDESAAFEPPPWLGREVTACLEYRNQSLAVNGLPV